MTSAASASPSWQLLVAGAQLVWTGSRAVADASVLCGAGVVGDLGTLDPPPGADVLDARGCVVVPGLVNAHHHLLQSAFRTLPGTRGVPMRAWLATMSAAYAAARVDAELCGAAAAVAIAEGLLCGVTSVSDHQLTWPAGGDWPAMAEAVADAAALSGARLTFVRGCGGAADPGRLVDAVEALAERLGSRGGGEGSGPVALAVGPAGVHSDGPETFAALREVALRHGLARRTQANEQVDVEIAAERYGARPLQLLADWGWLEPDVTVAHLCEITDDEVAAFAASGARATHAPGCDLPMGWGLAPVAALLDAGVTVGLGTSGGGSNDAGHLLADARLALQVAPLAGRALTALEVLTMATGGASIEPGGAADLAVYDVSGVADAGVADPLAGLLWASPGRRPRHVVAGGRVVVRDGALVGVGEQELAARLRDVLGAR